MWPLEFVKVNVLREGCILLKKVRCVVQVRGKAWKLYERFVARLPYLELSTTRFVAKASSDFMSLSS